MLFFEAVIFLGARFNGFGGTNFFNPKALCHYDEQSFTLLIKFVLNTTGGIGMVAMIPLTVSVI